MANSWHLKAEDGKKNIIMGTVADNLHCHSLLTTAMVVVTYCQPGEVPSLLSVAETEGVLPDQRSATQCFIGTVYHSIQQLQHSEI